MVAELTDLVFNLFGLAADAIGTTIKVMVRWLLRILIAGSLFFAFGWISGWQWPVAVGTYLFLMFGILAGIIFTIAKVIVEFPSGGRNSLRRGFETVSGIIFWALNFVVLFSIVPVWNRPWAVVMIFALCAILVLGYVRFGIGLSPEIAVIRTIIIFIGLAIVLFVPSVEAWSKNFLATIDMRILRSMNEPKEVRYSLNTLDQLILNDPMTNKPNYWFCLNTDGRYLLFDRTGYCTVRPEKLVIFTEIEREKLKSILRKEEEEKVKQEEERKRREEEARKEEEERIKREEEEKQRKKLEQAAIQDSPQPEKPPVSETTSTPTVIVAPKQPEEPEPEFYIRKGTEIYVTITEEINTRHNLPGEVFRSKLQSTLTTKDLEIARLNDVAFGEVGDIRRQNNIYDSAKICLLLKSINTPAGTLHIETDAFCQEVDGASLSSRSEKMKNSTGQKIKEKIFDVIVRGEPVISTRPNRWPNPRRTPELSPLIDISIRRSGTLKFALAKHLVLEDDFIERVKANKKDKRTR